LLLDLFTWWIISISWSIVFLVVVGVYLYVGSRSKRRESVQVKSNAISVAGRFMVLWILLGLLAFYIVSVYFGSSTFFAVGNIVVEVILIIHVVKNRTK
jgi:hypothetical protein